MDKSIFTLLSSYSQISRTTVINANTKDILMNIHCYVKFCYLRVLSDSKLKDLSVIDFQIIKEMWKGEVFYLMTQSSANVIQHQRQTNKTGVQSTA